MRRLVLVLFAGSLLMGCGNKIKKLSAPEQDHYYALKVWMNKDQEKAFFKYKTTDERDAYLKDSGLWDRFYKYDADMRGKIVAGEVEDGWPEDAVFMAWGNPIARRRLTGRPAARSELFTWRFEVDQDGIVRVWVPKSNTSYKAVHQYEMDVYIDDMVVTEMVKRDKW